MEDFEASLKSEKVIFARSVDANDPASTPFKIIAGALLFAFGLNLLFWLGLH